MLANVAASFLCPNQSHFREGVPQIKDSNYPLAAELERENDLDRNFSVELSDVTVIETPALASPTRIYSNVQYVEAEGGAPGSNGCHPVRCRTGIFTSPDRCPTQRDPIPMPLGL
jgi:hypothetical protein